MLRSSVTKTVACTVLLYHGGRPSRDDSALPRVRRILVRTLRRLHARVVDPVASRLGASGRRSTSRLFRRRVRTRYGELEVLNFAKAPVVHKGLGTVSGSLLPSLRAIYARVLGGVTGRKGPKTFTFVLSMKPSTIHVFTSGLCGTTVGDTPRGRCKATLVRSFTRRRGKAVAVGSRGRR